MHAENQNRTVMTAPFRRDTLLTKPHPEPSSTVWQPCQSFGTLWRYLREATIIRLHKGQAIKKTNANANRKGKSPQESAKNPESSIELIIEHYPSRADSHFSFSLSSAGAHGTSVAHLAKSCRRSTRELKEYDRPMHGVRCAPHKPQTAWQTAENDGNSQHSSGSSV
jgi:hypothetical protein